MAGDVDPRDVRLLVSRTTRAIYGPRGADPLAAQQLTVDQVKDLVADSIAKLIFYTEGIWPYRLVVVDRDSATGAPTEWRVEPNALPTADETLVTTQAALDFFFFEFKDKKVQEEIADEGQRWNYTLSAQVLKAQLDGLRAERDRALEALERRGTYMVDYVSFVGERDALTAAIVEWWVRPGLTYPSGQEVFPNLATFGP